MFRDGVARCLVFRLGRERYAVPLDRVDEVLELPAVQRVPDAAAAVHGLVTIRGTLTTLIDPCTLLGTERGEASLALLLARDGRRLGLVIDDVLDTMTIDAAQVRPMSGGTPSDTLLLGVVRVGMELTGLLDIDALLDAALLVADGETQ